MARAADGQGTLAQALLALGKITLKRDADLARSYLLEAHQIAGSVGAEGMKQEIGKLLR